MHRRGASLAIVIMPRYVQTNNQRKVQRAGKGSLKQRQIGKRCVLRYTAALERFFFLMPYLFGVWASAWEDRDLQVGAYVELLWSEGEARNKAGDLLSALQWHYSVRKVLTGSWQKFKTWSRLEPCAQVLPLPISALFAIVGYAISIGDIEFAAGVYLAFHCMLRTGELLELELSQIRQGDGTMILVLPDTKTTKRHGQTEYVDVECPIAKLLVRLLLRRRGAGGRLISCSPYFFRKRWQECMVALQLDPAHFAPYSLRRGGATHDFSVHVSFDRALTRGRWQCIRTARIYVRQGEEALARIAFSVVQQRNFAQWSEFLRGHVLKLEVQFQSTCP